MNSLRTSLWTLSLSAAALSFASPGEAAKTTPPPPDPSQFVRTIDNPYFPLIPGTTLVYEGESDGVPTTDEFTVTHKTISIQGVTCVVVRDLAYEDGELVERTSDYFAQDVDGNVWYFGEDTEELEDGEVVSTEGTWRAGVDGARAGIVMLAQPEVGDRYMQEVAPGVAEDEAKVLAVGESICVPYGCFDGVLRTKDWTHLEPSVAEEKSYAPGVGLVFAEIVRGGEEFVRLVSVRSGGKD
jgi:hypothetical protein